MTRRFLYLPIETKARELLGKTLLVSRAVERGWCIVFGGYWEVHMAARNGQPGVFLEMSIPELKAKSIQDMCERGHRVVNLCEESIVYTNVMDYCNKKVGPTSLEHTDLLLVPGRRNAEHVKKFRPEASSKIRITGNPRFDTLLPEVRVVYREEANRIRKAGRLLLVNTNFGNVNPFERDRDALLGYLRRGMITNEEQVCHAQRRLDYQKAQMEGLRELLAVVSSANLYDRIIVRPHPVENHQAWREWGEPYGIGVQYCGNANAWMLAAEMTLHSGCTTGIEGVLLDRPVASYVLDPNNEFLNAADRVSVRISSANEVLALAEKRHDLSPQNLREATKAKRSFLRRYIENVEHPLAVDRILDVLEELDTPEHPPGTAPLLRGPSWWVQSVFRRGRRTVQRLRHGGLRRSQKFGELSLDEMLDPIDVWVSAGILKMRPSFRRLGKNLWVVHERG